MLSSLLLIVSARELPSRAFNNIPPKQSEELVAQRAVTTTAQTTPAQTDTQEQQAIRQRLQEFRRLYSFGSRKFSFEGYDVYINTDELMAYDNLAPKDTKINGWNNYRSLWETFINDSSSNQEITRFDIDRIETSGDLGWSGVTMRFRAKNQGKYFYSSQHFTHIWHKVNGKWRIVHEHAFSPVKVNGKEVLP
jgi:ketosteroid isomerase-like protein